MTPTNDQIREVIGGDVPDKTIERLRALCGLSSTPCSEDRCVGSGECVQCCPDCDSLRSNGYDDGPCDRHGTNPERMPLDAALELADRGSDNGGIMTNEALKSLAKGVRDLHAIARELSARLEAELNCPPTVNKHMAGKAIKRLTDFLPNVKSEGPPPSRIESNSERNGGSPTDLL